MSPFVAGFSAAQIQILLPKAQPANTLHYKCEKYEIFEKKLTHLYYLSKQNDRNRKE